MADVIFATKGQAEEKIVKYVQATAAGVPTVPPTPEDFAAVERFKRRRSFAEGQERGYESLANQGPSIFLTSKELASLTDTLRELGLDPLTRGLIKAPYRLPGPLSEGGYGITRREAVAIYEEGARLASGASVTGKETPGDLIRTLESWNKDSNKNQIDQLRALETMIKTLRQSADAGRAVGRSWESSASVGARPGASCAIGC